LIIAIGYAIPEKYNLPVANMNGKSFNHQSFWYYPWGASICHKGVDIFAPKGNEVYAATSGMIINVGNHPRGGNMILIIGPKWRIHHYLHLDTIIAQQFHFVSRGTTIGKVGNSGNASNKPSHLHYSITTIIPYLWQADNSIQGYKKIWFIDPTPYLLNKQNN
jgi:murein DD-endopeptidase MepM/ murein hydrolase activator NlpD